jgi:hypothetical protein
MPTTRSSSHASNDDAPTLSFIMSFLESMKSDIILLKNDTIDIKSMQNDIVTLKTDLQNLSGHFASTVSSLQVDSTTAIQDLQVDMSDRFNTMSLTIDSTVDAVRSELTTAIKNSTAPIDLSLSETQAQLTAIVQDFRAKFATLKGLSVSDDRVLQILHNSNLDNIRNLILSPVVDDIINDAVKSGLAPLSQDIQLLKSSSTTIPLTTRLKTGFSQTELKDFNVSKFIKETDRITLAGDLLVNLEHFWDLMLRIFNMLCLQNQVYSCYHDLKKEFDFKNHLCDQTRLSPTDLQQALLNYCAFGDSLHIFLLAPPTITKSDCPKAYLNYFP